MRVTFRAKLLLIVGTAAAAILGVLSGSAVIAIGQTNDLNHIESKLVPKLELDPKLRAGFDRLRQSLQDAVAAQELTALDAASRTRAELITMVTDAGSVLEEGRALELRLAIEEYYETAEGVSRRMIAGETGEKIVDDMAIMQTKFSRAGVALERAVVLSKSELAEGFALVRSASARADRFRAVMGLGGLVLLVGLSLWLGRGLVKSLAALRTGLVRFSTGDLDESIVVASDDELSDLARQANDMAASLRRTGAEKAVTAWLRDGHAGLADALRGATTPKVAADRAVEFLARRVDACAACLYVVEGNELVPLGGYAAEWQLPPDGNTAPADPNAASVLPRFALGQGLLGQAALADDVTVVRDIPPNYVKVRSSLGEAVPRYLVFVPLVREQERTGVIEFALLGDLSARALELLSWVQEAVVIALRSTQSRATLERLLLQSREMTDRLTAQEEELRASNEELHSQQQELRVANEELEDQREALRLHNATLQAAQGKLQQTARELEQVSAYKSQFLARMSHELRTPLNSMLLLSQLLSETRLSSEQVAEHARTIHSAGNDLLALINQILDLAKIESGKQEMTIAPVRLHHFAQYVERVFRPLATNKGLELRIEVADDVPEAMTTDARRLERILTNLVGNAIKFTRVGHVTLRIGRPARNTRWQQPPTDPASYVSFAVEDTGVGIPQQSIARIFAPFEQVMEDRDASIEGTGLGLAIAHESSRLLGGDLYVESTLGHGTTFTCILPQVLSSDTEHIAVSVAPSSTAKDDAVDLATDEPYVLIVEDDKIFAEQLVEITHGRKLKAVVATTGEQALEMARRHVPWGIILDVRLPDIDGFAVVNKLRQDPLTAAVPVHFISGVDAKQRGLHVGAVGYLVKPASRGELVGAVRSLVSAGSDESARVLVVEDDPRDGRSVLEILRHENIEAEHVTSAGAARRALNTEAFGCVILDLGLPDMDGLDLLEAFSLDASRSLPRVIVYTGRALTKAETRRLEAYAEAIILKDGTSSSERLAEELRLFVHHVEEAATRRGHVALLEPQLEVSLAGYKLLLVDDDMRTAFALSAILRSKGAEVLVGDTGKEALALLAQHPDVDAVLMDIMMPEMDGYEAMREVRKMPKHARLPIIALTARAMKGERERCLEAGASDYLSKPVNSRQLVLILGSLLANGSSDR